MRSVPRSLLVSLFALLLFAGCGGSSDDSGSASGSDAGGDTGSSAAKLVHVDGVVTLDGDTMTVTPKEGEAQSFAVGPAIERAELMAIVSSQEAARVTYREGEDVAAALTPAPKVGSGVESYEGTVVSVDERSLVIKGADGERTFDISAADPGAFDTHHLTDHGAEGEPIRVYFRADAPDVGISYEDA